MKNLTVVAGALVCGLFIVAPAVAGNLTGLVVDDGGRGLGGASVVLEELERTEVTDNNGNFAFRGVPDGEYTITYTMGENRTTETVSISGNTSIQKMVDWQISFAEAITVTTASLRPERITEAPSAITVITEMEIEREASHGQAPKLLEFTPGTEVTQSGIYDYNLNTRGFNSSLNRRVATLIDGRNPSVPFLGAQEWAAISFPLDDLSAVEMLRGPSAALYGANASSGVLNMITKQPRAYQGGLIRFTGGELSTTNADLRWATELGNEWYMKLVGGYRNHDDFFVSRMGAAEYSVPCPVPQGNATDCLPQEAVPLATDEDQIEFYGLRFDKHLERGDFLTLEAGTASIEGPVFQTGLGRVQLLEVDRPWWRTNYTARRFNVLAYQTKRDAPQQLALSSGANLELDTERVRLEVQGNWEFMDGRSRVVAGGMYGEEDVDGNIVFQPISTDQQAAYVQLDMDISPEVRLVLAGRYDDSTLHDSQFSPKGSLVWSITPDHTLRFSYNEGFQVANYSEFFLAAPAAPPVDLSGLNALVCLANGVDCGLGVTPVLALGNVDLALEEVQMFEIGWSGIFGDRAFVTIDYYNSENEQFITDLLPNVGTPLGRLNQNFGPWQAPPGVPAQLQAAVQNAVPLLSNAPNGSNILAAVTYTNFGQVDTQGIDFGLNYYVNRDWTVKFSYSWFDFEIQDESNPLVQRLLPPNSPENKMSLGLNWVGDSVDVAASMRWVDDFRWAVGPFQGNVESYTVVDLVGNWAINDNWTVGANVANILDEEHWESFGGDLLARRALGHITFSW